MSDPCREFAGTFLSLVGLAPICRQSARLISVHATLPSDSVLAQAWLWVWDGSANSPINGVITTSNLAPDGRPLVTPIRLIPGDTASIAPPTRWLPCCSGIVAGLSSSETTFLDATTDASRPYNIGFHFALGGC